MSRNSNYCANVLSLLSLKSILIYPTSQRQYHCQNWNWIQCNKYRILSITLQGLLAKWVIWHTPFQLFAPSFPPHLEKPWWIFKMWGKAWRVSDFTVSNRLRNHLKPLNKCPGNVLERNKLVMVKTTYLISFPVHRPLSCLLNGQHCSIPQSGLTHWQKYTETKM